MINAILAVDETGAIGFQNKLPWKTVKEDMGWFQLMTVKQIVVMGRGTWNSDDMKRPLPRRENWVVTSTIGPELEGANVWHGDPLELCQKLEKDNPTKIVWVIGGAKLFESLRGTFNRIYVTRIMGRYKADTFVNIDKLTEGYELIYNNLYEGIGLRIKVYERIQ